LMARDHLVRATRERLESEDEVSTPDGARTYYSVGFPVPVAGSALPLVGVIATDVTERLELEHRVAQAERLETVGELAGGIAHDFNNLLTVIGGWSQLALAEAPTEGLREPLRHVIHATERAAWLSGQLLSFARGAPSPGNGQCDLNSVVLDVETLLRPLVEDGIALRLDLGDVQPVTLSHDRLEQVLMNLAVNARDAMTGGGELCLRTRPELVDHRMAQTHPALRPGPHAILEVVDSGAGMSPHVREHAFEPFFTTKAPGRGTGLGLASVYGLVTSSGGWIELESREGAGTTVRVWLPVAKKAVAERAAGAGDPDVVRGAGRVVLLVEDEPSLRNLVTRQLEAAGFVVSAAGSVADALRLAEQLTRIDLVVCDVVLTDGMGPEVVERLRADRPDLAVLFMSGYTERTRSGHGRLDPSIPLLSKPFDVATLHRAVAAVLSPA
jgi:two-component system, cell cycle sensor histidine kinase and response regulator CckA